MTHIFDTGLTKPARTIVQQGAVALLSPLLRRNGGYLLDVLSFGAVVRSYTDEIGVSMLVDKCKRAPAIAVATGTRNYQVTGIGGREATSDLELVLYFFSGHARDLQVGRMEADVTAIADDTADPGLHVIMEHTMELLLGQYTSVSTTIKQLRPESEQELATLEHHTIWMQTYAAKCVTRIGGGREWRTAAQLLESIHWRVTTKADETVPPVAATSSTSVDVDTNL